MADSPMNETMKMNRLPLHELHIHLGARLGAFGDWEVPLYYSSVIEEHLAVRNNVGIFDISHMGQIFFEGSEARKALNLLLSDDMEKLADGKANYNLICNEKGGIVDDVVVYQLERERYLVIVNAANREKDYRWFTAHQSTQAKIEDRSMDLGLLSLQGPSSLSVMNKLWPKAAEGMGYYSIRSVDQPWRNVWIARTGYTGEHGYEILMPVNDLREVYLALLDAGREFEIKPIGFGARDTLRLEAGMLLYGQDMNEETNPFQVGLTRKVCLTKEFIGKEALLEAAKKKADRSLIGFEMVGRGLARHGQWVRADGIQIGSVTSGSYSPTLKKNIGRALIAQEYATAGKSIEIEIRGQWVEAKVIEIPFYRRPKRSG